MYAKAVERRWYHPKPAWLVYGAVVATGVLFASERWRWFPEHYQKGWPVLLAVAVVAAVLVLLPAWMLAGVVFRRRVQFGLRTLLVFVTLCAVVCSWLAVRIKQAGRQADLLAMMHESVHGLAWYDWQLWDNLRGRSNPLPRGPGPLVRLLGVDFFADVTMFAVEGPLLPDAELARLTEITRLESLYLEGDDLTDAKLSHIEKMTDLRELHLVYTKVTKEGVAKVQHALPKCKIEVQHDRP